MQKQESSQNEGKNEKRFEKKLFLAILHDNSRGKSMKKLQQDWKNENDKKKKRFEKKFLVAILRDDSRGKKSTNSQHDAKVCTAV